VRGGLGLTIGRSGVLEAGAGLRMLSGAWESATMGRTSGRKGLRRSGRQRFFRYSDAGYYIVVDTVWGSVGDDSRSRWVTTGQPGGAGMRLGWAE